MGLATKRNKENSKTISSVRNSRWSRAVGNNSREKETERSAPSTPSTDQTSQEATHWGAGITGLQHTPHRGAAQVLSLARKPPWAAIPQDQEGKHQYKEKKALPLSVRPALSWQGEHCASRCSAGIATQVEKDGSGTERHWIDNWHN